MSHDLRASARIDYLTQLGQLRGSLARRDGYWEEQQGRHPSSGQITHLDNLGDDYEELEDALQRAYPVDEFPVDYLTTAFQRDADTMGRLSGELHAMRERGTTYGHWGQVTEDEEQVLDLASHHGTADLPLNERRLIRNLQWLQQQLNRLDARLEMLVGRHFESRDAEMLRNIGRVMERASNDYAAVMGDERGAQALDASTEMARLAGVMDQARLHGHNNPAEDWGRTLNNEIQAVNTAAADAIEAILSPE
ncbi:MAG: hypothetical protein AAF654_09340 [Myxococcota bacterium]